MKRENIALTLLGLQLLPQYAYAESNEYEEAGNKDDLNILIFDDRNDETYQYGANQNTFELDFDNLIKEPLVYQKLQDYYPEKGFSSKEEAMVFYRKLFSLIREYGCGYTSAADYIFRYFEGREEEFENIFGYPMYYKDEKGNINFNYELFVIDFFNYYSLKKNNMTTENMKSYLLSDYYEKEFLEYASSEEYNRKMPKDFEKWSEEDWVKWYEFDNMRKAKWQDLYIKYNSCVHKNINFAIPLENRFGEIESFLSLYGLDIDVEYYPYYEECNIDDIIVSDNFTLYKETKKGLRYMFRKNLKSHYMYVCGFTSDGRIIVSTWGEKYILDNSHSKYDSKLVLKIK